MADFWGAEMGMAQERYVPDLENSRLWIEGRATRIQYNCNANTRAITFSEMRDANPGEIILQDRNGELNGPLRIYIPVTWFDCGLRRMNEDFKEALKADQYDHIIFELKNTDAINTTDPNRVIFQVEGELTVAGVTNPISVEIIGRNSGNDGFRIQGQRQIYMSDYNINPPTALRGLIEVRDELTVHFDIVVRGVES